MILNEVATEDCFLKFLFMIFVDHAVDIFRALNFIAVKFVSILTCIFKDFQFINSFVSDGQAIAIKLSTQIDKD